MTGAPCRALEDVLSAYGEAGRDPQFWLRDDDAVEPTPALDRLLDLTGRFDIPVVLAVIPALATAALARRLQPADQVTVVVHGWSHANHADAGEKKQEFGPHRPTNIVLQELARGLQAITDGFGGKAFPVLVPPWNRIDAALLPSLEAMGFRALSTYGDPKPAPLPVVNPTIDIIDWHGSRRCRDHAALADELVIRLRQGLSDPTAPAIGILTHHLVHDEAAWIFLAKLFELTASRCGGRWRTIESLMLEAENHRAS